MTNYLNDPALYIYTSLTAGSAHIVTATSRLETILRANRIPFKAIDIAVDTKARLLWGRRAGKDANGRARKLPALIQEGWVVGDYVEIEEWNERSELKEQVKIYFDEYTIPSINDKLPDDSLMRPVYPMPNKSPVSPAGIAMMSAVGAAAAAAAASPKSIPTAPPLPATKTATSATPKVSTAPKAEAKALPVRSVADEAAAKAKELRLKSLREKVHGKDGEKKKDATSTKSTEEPKKSTETPISIDSKMDGIQSPTSGSWAETDAARNAIQSPTTGTWKEGHSSSDPSAKPSSIEAGLEDAKAADAKTAVKEEPALEKKSQKGVKEEDPKKDGKKDAKKDAKAASKKSSKDPKKESKKSSKDIKKEVKKDTKGTKKEAKKDSRKDSKKDSKKEPKKESKK
ncbi:hypothetical protein NXS19_009281 [Fusarium pseudograminearum]|nr:hypothetical protein NXS19_009281 [Fusarium pseudograminearum]